MLKIKSSRPEKTYRSFTHFANEVRCLGCKGVGRVVECHGYENYERKRCGTCGGGGYQDRDELKQAWLEWSQKYQRRLEAWQQWYAAARSAVSKLSDIEIMAVSSQYNPFPGS